MCDKNRYGHRLLQGLEGLHLSLRGHYVIAIDYDTWGR